MRKWFIGFGVIASMGVTMLFVELGGPQPMLLTCALASHPNGVITYDERGQSNGWMTMTYRTGIVMVIGVVNATNQVFLECSTDRVGWRPYPTNYFQLMVSNTLPAYVALDRSPMFFRARY